MISLADYRLLENKSELKTLPIGKVFISTMNAHSYNVTKNDPEFAKALLNSDVLIPDGVGIVIAERVLYGKKLSRIAGADLFAFEMNRLNSTHGVCLFMGGNDKTLELISKNAAVEYPNIKVITFSPPYKDEYSEEENARMVDLINEVKPDLLWIGLTAPKQEKWVYRHLSRLDVNCHIGCIGAVFDFYAGTVKRAPLWMQKIGLEWLYRLLKEPKRLWRRYLVGNLKFLFYVLRERYH